MIELHIPGRDEYRLEHLVLDLNGTLAIGGQLAQGVAERLARLRELLAVHVVTADTRGRQGTLETALGVPGTRITARREAAQKAAFVRKLGGEAVCAMGNGANDAAMLREAALAIAVLGEEGLAVETLNAADVVTPHINPALDPLLDPPRLVATLRR